MSDIHDRQGKMMRMAGQLEEMCKQVNYIDEAMKFLSTHMIKDHQFVKTPFIDTPSVIPSSVIGQVSKTVTS